MTPRPAARGPSPPAGGQLVALHRSGTLVGDADPALMALVRLASAITRSPIAAITLLDRNRQWYVAALGIPGHPIRRSDSFCDETVSTDRLVVVGDATLHPRFQHLPLVRGREGVRFYAGVPLHVDTTVAGALCVMDRVPRALEAAAVSQLADLGTLVEAQLRLHRASRDLERTARELDARLHDMQLLDIMTRELASQRTAADVLRVVAAAAAALTTTTEPVRTQVMHVDQGVVTIAAEYDQGAMSMAGHRFELIDHPALQRCLAEDRVVTASVAIDDAGPTLRPILRNLGIHGGTYIPLGDGDALAIGYRTQRVVSRRDHERLAALAPITRIALNNATHAEQLADQARHDGLTGLSNRRGFDETLETLPRGPYSIVAMDADHLKQVNDADGHAAGDRMLRAIADALRHESRRGDVVARIGGDEFAVMLSGAGEVAAHAFAQRVQARLAQASPPISVSAGVEVGADPASARAVWRTADDRMYEQKRSRR